MLVQLKTLHQFVRDRRNAFSRMACGKLRFLVRLRVVHNNPKSRPVHFVIAGANRAGQLDELERVQRSMR